MLPIALLVVPLLTALTCRLLYRRPRAMETVNAFGALSMMALALAVAVDVARTGPREALSGLLYVDALSAVMLGTIGVIGAAAALVSIRYLRHDLAIHHVPDGRRGAGWYYLGLHGFIWTMLFTVSVDNLGLLWVGIEATTLASALLVGFYRTGAALEAAWKYVILCTVGITFALFGVLLTYFAAVETAAAGAASLDWTRLSLEAGQLDPAIMKLAFVFILVGFGAKAGFAPLHTWLADAHSLAPSPISGLLSGVLLSCALYGILRFHMLTTVATGTDFSGNLLLGFGLLSIAVATPFILVQRDVKRLLAYSSIEHIGLIAVAFGIGGPLGVYAGTLHLVNHAATKALLFFVTGDIVQRFGTRRISAIRGVLRASPLAGWLLLLGVFAITGVPPSGVFISELSIASAGLMGNRLQAVVAVAVVLLLGVIFAGMVAHALRIAYGARGPSDAHASGPSGPRFDLPWLAAIIPLAALVVVFGLVVPEPISALFEDVAGVLSASGTVASR
ncbi:MAG TPA: hydrogenase 4 subunit F [Thermomicrobiales bacterium]|nr:hydrogenase 4 subunit F [Thermomicrobiales bacterium]